MKAEFWQFGIWKEKNLAANLWVCKVKETTSSGQKRLKVMCGHTCNAWIKPNPGYQCKHPFPKVKHDGEGMLMLAYFTDIEPGQLALTESFLISSLFQRALALNKKLFVQQYVMNWMTQQDNVIHHTRESTAE